MSIRAKVQTVAEGRDRGGRRTRKRRGCEDRRELELAEFYYEHRQAAGSSSKTAAGQHRGSRHGRGTLMHWGKVTEEEGVKKSGHGIEVEERLVDRA